MSTDSTNFDKQKSDKIALTLLGYLKSNPKLYAQFLELKEHYGSVNPIREDGNIVIPTEFREGYLIKNILRQMELCSDWSEEDIKEEWPKKLNLALLYGDDKNIGNFTAQ